MIRRLEKEEIPRIMGCAKRHLDTVEHLDLDEEFFGNYLAEIWDFLAIIAIEEEGQIWGGVCGIKIKSPFSGNLACRVLFWYVQPEYRGKKSLILFRAIESWAKQEGCSYILHSALGGEEHDLVATLLRRKGYFVSETIFRKGLDHG